MHRSRHDYNRASRDDCDRDIIIVADFNFYVLAKDGMINDHEELLPIEIYISYVTNSLSQHNLSSFAIG